MTFGNAPCQPLGMLKGHRNTSMQDKTLDALVEALMPILFGPPIRRVWRSRLPKRKRLIGAGRGLWKDEIFPIAIATAFSNPASAGRTPTG